MHLAGGFNFRTLFAQISFLFLLRFIRINSSTETESSVNHCNSDIIHFDCVPCAYVLGPSKVGGIGVYAGNGLENGDNFEKQPYIFMHKGLAYGTPLINYVWSHNQTHFVLVFGATGMLNHQNGKENVDLDFNFGVEGIQDPKVSLVALKDIPSGEELFISYGDGQHWFESHGIKYVEIDTNHCFIEDLSNFPGKLAGCGDATHLQVTSSILEATDHYCVSSPFFIKKSTVIESARVFIFYKELLNVAGGKNENGNEHNSAELNLLLDLYFTKLSEEVVMFSLGTSITFAKTSVNQEDSNIKLEWIANSLQFGRGIAIVKVIATKDIEPHHPFVLRVDPGNKIVCMEDKCP